MFAVLFDLSLPPTRTSVAGTSVREAFNYSKQRGVRVYISRNEIESISRDVIANADMISRKWSGIGNGAKRTVVQKWHNLSTHVHTYIYIYMYNTSNSCARVEKEEERERHMAAKRPLRIARGTIEIGYRAGIPSEY